MISCYSSTAIIWISNDFFTYMHLHTHFAPVSMRVYLLVMCMVVELWLVDNLSEKDGPYPNSAPSVNMTHGQMSTDHLGHWFCSEWFGLTFALKT